MIRNALIRLLGGHLAPPDHGEPRPEIEALTARVSALEDLQLKREVEWAEVSEKVLRYLKRISAVEQRAEEREGKHHDADPVTRAVLSMKFPPKQQGG